MPFDHSFLSGGHDFSVFFNSFFYYFSSSYQSSMSVLFFHAALLCYSMLLGKNYSTLIHSFGRRLILYLYIDLFLSRISSIIPHVSPIPNFRKMPLDHSFLSGGIDSMYFSINSSINLHCSNNPFFWEGVDVACQTFLLSYWGVDVASSCIALSLWHFLENNYSTLIYSFGKGLLLL